jgi:hypothetical protein
VFEVFRFEKTSVRNARGEPAQPLAQAQVRKALKR